MSEEEEEEVAMEMIEEEEEEETDDHLVEVERHCRLDTESGLVMRWLYMIWYHFPLDFFFRCIYHLQMATCILLQSIVRDHPSWFNEEDMGVWIQALMIILHIAKMDRERDGRRVIPFTVNEVCITLLIVFFCIILTASLFALCVYSIVLIKRSRRPPRH